MQSTTHLPKFATSSIASMLTVLTPIVPPATAAQSSPPTTLESGALIQLVGDSNQQLEKRHMLLHAPETRISEGKSPNGHCILPDSREPQQRPTVVGLDTEFTPDLATLG